jgi:hypothetical protein
MRLSALVILMTLAGFGCYSPANAIGCVSGGLAGAVAGHMAHHGVLGAIGGCVAGHEYNKRQKRMEMQNQSEKSTQPSPGNSVQQ